MWDGLRARMNLYKCGDDLSHPHFLSWQPIEAPKPNFHLPAFLRRRSSNDKVRRSGRRPNDRT